MSNETTLLIRHCTHLDASLLAEMGRRMFSDAFLADNDPQNMAAYMGAAFTPAQLASELADPRSLFLIAEMGEPVGYAKLFAGDPPDEVVGEAPIELARIYVSQGMIGSGIGARLMQASINEARQRGYKTVWLGVWEHNPRARRFYRKWHFHEIGTHIFQLGSEAQTDILMVRSIGSDASLMPS